MKVKGEASAFVFCLYVWINSACVGACICDKCEKFTLSFIYEPDHMSCLLISYVFMHALVNQIST